MSDLSCMSFNVLSWDTGNCGFESPVIRFEYALRVIDEQAPDLLGLQEACEDYRDELEGVNWYARFKEELGARGYGCVGIKEQKSFAAPEVRIAYGLMIFYKKDRFTVTQSDCFMYPYDSSRYYLWSVLHDNQFDKDLLFTDTHFSINQKIADEHIPEATRAVRAVEGMQLARFWWEKTDKGRLALLATGDYNSTPNTDAQKILRSGIFKPSFMVAAERDEVGSCFDWWCYGGKDVVDESTLDYCFVNINVQQVDEYRVIQRVYPTDSTLKYAGHPTDHRPIMTYFSYK